MTIRGKSKYKRNTLFRLPSKRNATSPLANGVGQRNKQSSENRGLMGQKNLLEGELTEILDPKSVLVGTVKGKETHIYPLKERKSPLRLQSGGRRKVRW